ncbi:NAD(P)-binding protein [Corynespora cassiicola Philippines]|uniref:NAD(P)-binding protein n=1 Tax=Corynespora cassiicola Philippines TaxID=1448308 RepID=A0A2T2PD12_CORCC|nr:NAD(P)-binding protein [Corynespora cassiicola Philippines]
MSTAVLAGSTGLVGSQLLSQLLAHPSFTSVFAYARRDLPNPSSSPKLHPLTSTDSSTWPTLFPSAATAPSPRFFFSALGTTRAAAGSVEAQRKIDLDLNLALATAAKAAGVETYVLISSVGASSTSRAPYTQMKGELEDKVKELGFKNTVILRPGVLLGDRQESRPAEAVIRGVAGVLRRVSPALTDGWAQDVGIIARAAIRAAGECGEGKREGVWELGQGEISRLGKEEAK